MIKMMAAHARLPKRFTMLLGLLAGAALLPACSSGNSSFTISATEAEFTVNADPETTEKQPTTGVRHFYLDGSDNAVHANPTQSASKSDPVVGT